MTRYGNLVSVSIFCCCAATVSASVWHVPEDATTIQGGIALAATGDTVVIAEGVYYEHSILLTPGVNIRGLPDDPSRVVVDGSHAGRVFKSVGAWTPAYYSIEGITIQNGYAGGPTPVDRCGGALYSENFRLSVRDCEFIFNTVQSGGKGGAVYLTGNQVQAVENCFFYGNTGEYGGAIHLYATDVVFSNCVIDSNNAVQYGGGVYAGLYPQPPEFNNCSFIHNSAGKGGGGAWVFGARFDHCLIAGNQTAENPQYGRGGGVQSDGYLGLYNCTVVDNDAIHGGGVYVSNTVWFMENTVIAFNARGGAAYAGNFNNELHFWCNDIYGNTGGDWEGFIADELRQLHYNIAADPEFCGDAQPGLPYTLNEGSPCLPDSHCGARGAFGGGCTLTAAPHQTVDRVLLGAECFPNPFNSSVVIRYEIARDALVTAVIYDVRGEVVAALVEGAVEGRGIHEIQWDGASRFGRGAASSVYFFVISADEDKRIGRLVLAK